MQESQLLERIAKNDNAAFEKLYTLYKDSVYNTALSYVQDTSLAEEVVQDVFVKIYRFAKKFKGQSSVGTWIHRITITTALTSIKRKRKFVPLKEAIEMIDFVHPGVLLENQEKAKLLFKAIDSLPELQKTAFILSYIEGLPQKEVAKIMDSSVKAVESRLSRAKSNLRKKVKMMI